MESPEVAKLQKEIRSLKKQVERLEASRATFELMVDRNDKLLSSQLEQTQEARRRIVEITDNVPGVVFEFEKMRDGTARAPFVSGGMEALIGISAAEVMKDVSRYFATVLPEDVEGYVADIDRSAATRSDHRFTVRIRHAVSGEVRWLYVDAPAPHVDAEGSARWRGYLQDITDQKKMEDARRRAEQELQRQAEELNRINLLADSALDLTKTGYWHVPLDGSGWYVSSERAARIFGDPPSPGHRYTVAHWLEHVRLGDEAAAKITEENFAAAIAGTIPAYDATYAYKRPIDGRVVWIHAMGHVAKDANGKPIQMYGVTQDITDFKRLETDLRLALRESDRINLLADSALDLANAGHWHFPLDNSGCYIPSERAARILGELPNPDHRYRLDEWAEHVRMGDEAIAKLTAENFAAAIAGTIPMYDATYLYKRPIDGRLVWIHALGHVVKDAEGKPTDMYGVIQDITAFKQQEADLRLALQKSDDATKAKSAFLANMSHEIRTPMNGIMGMTELALDTELTAEQRDYLVTVKSSADALLSLINDILDFSKIEAGRIELDPIEFLLRDSIGDALSPLALRASAKGIELAYDVHPDVPDALIGDVYRLRQILVNLGGNAIKFTERGEVVLSVIQRERGGDDVTLEFAVRDTGIGISAEAAARLFKAFEQAEMSTTRKYGGTGLGLAISKQLVELMGGQIRLESTPGVGSTFIFTVRLKVGAARASASPEDAVRALHGKTALIVDDNETNRRILTAMLGHWGLRSLEADSGKAALATLDRASNAGQVVSIVVTDLRMPEMDGFGFTRAMRDHPRFGVLPVILLTSSASTGDQAICNELGIAARLHKPVKQSLLLDNIMRVLGAVDRSRAQAVPRDSAPEATNAGSRALRVLLAEDNPVNQKFAVRVLQGAGHTVTVANNGREAIDHTGSQEFDVVLMDVQMPEVDGLDATRAIRARERGRTRLPIIAMTANAMKGDREMCLEAGMDGYVPKPVKKEVLFAEVDRVLKEVSRGKNL